MARNVTFFLGTASGLGSRTLTITRMPRAGENTWLGTYPVTPTYGPTDQGAAVEIATIALPDNQVWQAVLRDVSASGVVNAPDSILNFHTGSLQFPGGREKEDLRLQILHMEDMSSSSSSSSQSSVSSSSWSSYTSSSSQS